MKNCVKGPLDLEQECVRYEHLVTTSPPNLQLLGLGTDAHVGFSMPWRNPHRHTHVSDLSWSTRVANARFFNGDPYAVPQKAITMGLLTLRSMAEAGTQLMLAAVGTEKAAAVDAALFGKIWAGCPAAFLRLLPNVTFFLDPAAAGPLLRPSAKASQAPS